MWSREQFRSTSVLLSHLTSIGQGNAFGGKNEDGDDEGGADDKAETVNNIIDAFKYQETQFTKAQYVTYFKTYAKKVKEHLEKNKPARVADF